MQEPLTSVWGWKVNREDRTAGGYYFSTYKTICRRNGEYSNAQSPHVDRSPFQYRSIFFLIEFAAMESSAVNRNHLLISPSDSVDFFKSGTNDKNVSFWLGEVSNSGTCLQMC